MKIKPANSGMYSAQLLISWLNFEEGNGPGWAGGEHQVLSSSLLFILQCCVEQGWQSFVSAAVKLQECSACCRIGMLKFVPLWHPKLHSLSKEWCSRDWAQEEERGDWFATKDPGSIPSWGTCSLALLFVSRWEYEHHLLPCKTLIKVGQVF